MVRPMKKTALCLCFLMAVLSLAACAFAPAGITKNAVVTLGESQKFSEDEVQAAADSILKKFRDFKGCDLKRLWYDEEKSDREADSYMFGGKGSENGVKKENVIVLFSNFYVGSTGGDGGFQPDADYRDWNWIVIRDSKTDKWRVDDWGY